MNTNYDILKEYETDDYQNRGGNYPSSGKPVGINVSQFDICCEFKNTSISTAENWLKKFLSSKNVNFKDEQINAYQTGDYEDDWVTAMFSWEVN